MSEQPKTNKIKEKSVGKDQFILAPSPHVGTSESIPRLMYTVVITLLPATFVGIYFFGPQALGLVLICILASVITEAVFQRGRGKKITVFDGSVILTGLLLALTLPPTFPYWAAVLGAVVAVALGKHIFGGLGYNIFNPALVGRAFLQAAFPVLITTWVKPFAWLSGKVDAVSLATPLALMKFEAKTTSHTALFAGTTGGSLGETSALAILVGGIYLLYKRYIEWRIPLSYLGTVALLGALFWVLNPEKYPDPLAHLLAGGLILGAFFMATDPVTIPITPRGYWIFGIGAGAIVMLIRLWGGLPEGVMYSILLMNAFTPLINQYSRPRVFGEKRE